MKQLLRNLLDSKAAHYASSFRRVLLGREIGEVFSAVRSLSSDVYEQRSDILRSTAANPLNRFGRRCFSQGDEDGITLEIVRRLGLKSGTYCEFGVGNGFENNTLILAAAGWKGFWIGGESLSFNFQNLNRFNYQREWVTLENIDKLARNGIEFLKSDIDYLSFDLDGNDYFFVRRLLEQGINPKVFVVEYNGKFPPPVRFKINYDPKHQWNFSDYFSASLQTFVDLFEEFGYKLVCCNSQTGCNAFFVRDEFSALFIDVPTEIEKLYQPPRYWGASRAGHSQSPKTVERIFSDA